MSEVARIGRAAAGAEAAFETLRSNVNPLAKQAAWESYATEWRRAVNLADSYMRKAGHAAMADTWFRECQNDQGLLYIWEAGNAERHDSAGSSNAHPNGLIGNPTDRTKAAVIHEMRLDGGRLSGRFENMSWTVREGRFELLPVQPLSKKREVVRPPTGTPEELAAHGLRFVAALHGAVRRVG